MQKLPKDPSTGHTPLSEMAFSEFVNVPLLEKAAQVIGRDLPEIQASGFSMSVWFWFPQTYSHSGKAVADDAMWIASRFKEDSCGTVACLAGHLAIREVGFDLPQVRAISDLYGELYMRAYTRLFTWFDPQKFDGVPQIREEEFSQNTFLNTYLFSGKWAGTDNSPRGAYLRLIYVLQHGLPDNSEAQVYGLAPLSYDLQDQEE